MNKNRFFNWIKIFKEFSLTDRKTISVDFANNDSIFFCFADRYGTREVSRLPSDTFQSITNGQIENSEQFLQEMSFVDNVYLENKITGFAVIAKKVLILITRQELDLQKKELIKSAALQILFDECVFSSHKKIFTKYVSQRFGESHKDRLFFRLYNDEIYVDTIADKSLRLDIYPELFVFALKEFLEKKYKVSIRNICIQDVLNNHFAINPKTIGKKKIRYKIFAQDSNSKSTVVEPSFSEVAEAIRPISKSMIVALTSPALDLNQNEFYFYSACAWISKFLTMQQHNPKIHFIDIDPSGGMLFIKESARV